MYNLSLEGTGRQGYFRWKEDICAFIGRHWNFLLGTRSGLLSLSPCVHSFLFCCHGHFSSVQEKNLNVVEHRGRMSVGGKSHLLPLGSAGVRRAGLVEAGPEPTSDPETRGGQIDDQGQRWEVGRVQDGLGQGRAEAPLSTVQRPNPSWTPSSLWRACGSEEPESPWRTPCS